MTTLESNTKPIEVWLSQPNMQVTCRVIFEDETDAEIPVDSLSMRGAQREITAWLISQGYEPAGRWASEFSDEREGVDLETVRQFRKTKAA